jgi:predicted AlkP superfamily phosphohydrolase/phosphomutase
MRQFLMTAAPKFAFAAVVAMVVTFAVGGCTSSERSSRVLVFGIDGGTWDVMVPMIEAGELPNIAKLYHSGLRGVLVSRPPAISPVVWSTIFTGRPLSEHGVRSWKTSQSTHRKVKAVWEIVSDLGLATKVVNVPSTWPSEVINGDMLSGFPLSGSTLGGNTGVVTTKATLGDNQHPPAIRTNVELLQTHFDALGEGEWSDWITLPLRNQPKIGAAVRVKRLEGDKFYVTPVYRTDEQLVVSYPPELRARVQSKLDGPYVPEGPGWSKHADDDTPKYLYEHLVQVSRLHTAAVNQLIVEPWELFIYVNTLVDRVSHPYWAYSRPDDYVGLDRPKAALYASAVADSYRETDRQLGEVLAGIDGEHYTVIVSDHGFGSSVNKSVYIGTHEFDGIYLISGPGLAGEDGPRAYIEDVAPTLLYLLGKPVAEDMKGRVIAPLAGVLGWSVESVATYEGRGKDGSEFPVDEKTWEQLRGLGYVDGPAPKGADKTK